MASYARSFGLAILLVLGGLAVMLYGVSLNHGAEPNGPIVVGGVILTIAIGVLSMTAIKLDEAH